MMALLVESQMRARAQRTINIFESTDSVLSGRITKQASVTKHDIFLSHAFDDKELVLGVALSIEDMGYSVYLDWRDDPTLDRNKVTPATAEKLRARMKSSRCLFFSTTENASDSKWMPWELGYKDGHNSRAAILPISSQVESTFNGQQYLGIYPYVSKETGGKSQTEKLWINRTTSCYVSFDEWLEGIDPTQRGV